VALLPGIDPSRGGTIFLKDFDFAEILSDAGPGGPSLEITRFLDWGFQVLYWRTPDESHPSFEQLSQLANQLGFTAGNTADAEDVVWQCERFISNYELHSKPHDHLPKVFDPVWERNVIDVSRNPGRRTQFPGMWLESGDNVSVLTFDTEALV